MGGSPGSLLDQMREWTLRCGCALHVASISTVSYHIRGYLFACEAGILLFGAGAYCMLQAKPGLFFTFVIFFAQCSRRVPTLPDWTCTVQNNAPRFCRSRDHSALCSRSVGWLAACFKATSTITLQRFMVAARNPVPSVAVSFAAMARYHRTIPCREQSPPSCLPSIGLPERPHLSVLSFPRLD